MAVAVVVFVVEVVVVVAVAALVLQTDTLRLTTLALSSWIKSLGKRRELLGEKGRKRNLGVVYAAYWGCTEKGKRRKHSFFPLHKDTQKVTQGAENKALAWLCTVALAFTHSDLTHKSRFFIFPPKRTTEIEKSVVRSHTFSCWKLRDPFGSIV